MTFKHETNKAIKIFSQLYVGVKKPNSLIDIPLAFATPYETNAAGLKRQSSVMRWLGGEYDYAYENGQRTAVKASRDIRIVDNTLRTGFKITDDIKRVYWGGGNVMFRIHDPYGFELEIDSGNLTALIQTVGILPGGEVPGKCVWARDGSKNILITEGSVEYQSSVKAAETIKKPKALGQAEKVIGSTYRLSTGEFGQYLGKVFLIFSIVSENHYGPNLKVPIVVGQVPKHTRHQGTTLRSKTLGHTQEQYEAVLIGTEISGTELCNRTVKLYKKASLTERLDEVLLSPDEAVSIANQCQISTATSAGYHKICEMLSVKEPSSVSFTFRTLRNDEYITERKNLKQKLNQESKHGTSMTIGRAFRYDNTILRVQTNDGIKTFSNSEDYLVPDAFERTVIKIMAPCSIQTSGVKDDTVQFLSPNNYSSNYRGYTSSFEGGEVFILPTFKTVDEALEAFDAEYEAGNLLTIGVQIV
jgi:hypothetical protein